MNRSPRVGVVGHVTEDVYDSGLEPGGCATYASCVLHKLACQVEVHTCAAPDWTHPISSSSLVLHRSESPVTTRFDNRFRADGTRKQMLLQQAEPLPVCDISRLDWLHVVPVLDEVNLEQWIPRLVEARREGATISVGFQGFTRRAETSPGPVEFKGFDPQTRWLDAVDMVFLSDEDLAGRKRLLRELVSRVPVVFLTLGRRGARVWRHGRKIREAGIFDTQVQDPTGAGDTFAAGVVGSLARGDTLDNSLRCAAALASQVIESPGLCGLFETSDLERRQAQIEVA